jgi:hypothetical protein
MKSNRTRLVAGTVSAIVLSAPLALAFVPSLIITNLTGTMHVVQDAPCGDAVDARTSIAGGRMDITPSLVRGDVIGAPVLFHLTRADVFFTPFSVPINCFGLSATVDFREIGVRLASAVTFPGEAVGGPDERLYRFSIPKEQIALYKSVLDNAPFSQPETIYVRPSEDITGLIDLRGGTVQMHVALASRLRLRLGCVRNRCLIDETFDGTQTAEVSGLIHVPGTDTDRDRVVDLYDNCPLVANPTQSPVATPVITAPRNVTLNSCQVDDVVLADASDVCNARPVALDSNAPARFGPGRTVVRWRANDGIDPIVTAQTVVRVTDRTPPSVSCTAVPATTAAGLFRVSAADDCAGRTTVRLGSYSLADEEVIRITQTTRPGVRLVGRFGGIRHFQVGPGDGVIRATDAAGNAASVACQ